MVVKALDPVKRHLKKHFIMFNHHQFIIKMIATQCGNVGNLPPLQKFFVKLIYSIYIYHSVESDEFLRSLFLRIFREIDAKLDQNQIQCNFIIKTCLQKFNIAIFCVILRGNLFSIT